MADTNLKLNCEHIKRAVGPFLDILDNQFVVLQDSQAVFSFSSPVPDASAHGMDDRSSCAKCKMVLQAMIHLEDWSRRRT